MKLTQAWLMLAAVTCASVFTAEYSGDRKLAVAIIMAITAAKSAIIASRFMELANAPMGIRIYMIGWIVSTALMIACLFWFSAS